MKNARNTQTQTMSAAAVTKKDGISKATLAFTEGNKAMTIMTLIYLLATFLAFGSYFITGNFNCFLVAIPVVMFMTTVSFLKTLSSEEELFGVSETGCLSSLSLLFGTLFAHFRTSDIAENSLLNVSHVSFAIATAFLLLAVCLSAGSVFADMIGSRKVYHLFHDPIGLLYEASIYLSLVAFGGMFITSGYNLVFAVLFAFCVFVAIHNIRRKVQSKAEQARQKRIGEALETQCFELHSNADIDNVAESLICNTGEGDERLRDAIRTYVKAIIGSLFEIHAEDRYTWHGLHCLAERDLVDLDCTFDILKMENPDSYAAQNYEKFRNLKMHTQISVIEKVNKMLDDKIQQQIDMAAKG